MNLASKIILIITVLIAGFLAPDAINYTQQYLNQPSEKLSIEQYCMLSSQPCTQNSVKMTLNKDVIKPLVTSQITVQWQHSEAETLQLTMQGLEGELGTVKYLLKRVSDNKFQGNITLPVCTLDEMTWLGQLTDGKATVYPALKMKR
ncbi:hypothetical protein KO495_08360 [Colwellia sp. D2M02]|uniref:hypothetical protein n=1 Tax=Colwellia sp. D2M02 TaxID=2841562 RepID=UPI001C09128B|nr:hypothetical protein [Colwellia sp. D2M02]MBU2893340.1 hypothetical protein [Colwellia sp. D2M02]